MRMSSPVARRLAEREDAHPGHEHRQRREHERQQQPTEPVDAAATTHSSCCRPRMHLPDSRSTLAVLAAGSAVVVGSAIYLGARRRIDRLTHG